MFDWRKEQGPDWLTRRDAIMYLNGVIFGVPIGVLIGLGITALKAHS